MAAVASSTPTKVIPVNEAKAPEKYPALYDEWAESLGIPIHRGFFVDDVRTLPLGWWEERQCFGAIVQLAGQEHITEVKVTEIPPGKTTAPSRMAIDEAIYVADGRGVASVWANGKPKKNMEWSKYSLFLIPRGHFYQLSNTQGDRPVRLLHFSYLRLVMQMVGDPQLFFRSSHVDLDLLYAEDGSGYYSEARSLSTTPDSLGRRNNVWSGNFFPDLRAWDRLMDSSDRGGASQIVGIEFPRSPITSHMAVFPPQYYKKAHRHSGGTVIVIPKGEGYSLLWHEHGDDKVLIPWHEGSVMVPPTLWWHQHFNIGGEPARYMALHPPPGLPGDYFEDHTERDQVEYPDEEPIVRQRFEEELTKRGLKSLMPEQAYRDRDFRFSSR